LEREAAEELANEELERAEAEKNEILGI